MHASRAAAYAHVRRAWPLVAVAGHDEWVRVVHPRGREAVYLLQARGVDVRAARVVARRERPVVQLCLERELRRG